MAYFDGHDPGCRPVSRPCLRCRLREKLEPEELAAIDKKIGSFGLDLDFDFSKISSAKVTDFPLAESVKETLTREGIVTFGDLGLKLAKGAAKELRELEAAGLGELIGGLNTIAAGLEKLKKKRTED